MSSRTRVPRGVISAVGQRVRSAINPYTVKNCYVGSYRRGLPTCGDLDILLIPLAKEGIRVSEAFASVCEGGRLESGSGGDLDIGVVSGISVNLFYTTAEDWGAALLYSTGSKTYNIACRAWAKTNGFLLNEHGVFHRSGARIPDSGFSERAALRILGLPWLPPSHRTGSCFGVERTWAVGG